MAKSNIGIAIDLKEIVEHARGQERVMPNDAKFQYAIFGYAGHKLVLVYATEHAKEYLQADSKLWAGVDGAPSVIVIDGTIAPEPYGDE